MLLLRDRSFSVIEGKEKGLCYRKSQQRGTVLETAKLEYKDVANNRKRSEHCVV
jgi:hypothetical protein